MEKLSLLSKIRDIYEQNSNMMQYLRNSSGNKYNSVSDIMISYDFQAGSYVNLYMANPKRYEGYISHLARIIEELPGRKRTIFEPGVGEATTLVPLLNKLNRNICAGGGDISWSRVKVAQGFSENYLKQGKNRIVMADMFALPLADSSVDVVYTSHAMEPNGGHEVELLKELYRVTSEYLILLEPAYEFASMEAKAHMEKNGYVRNLYQAAKSLDLDVIVWELYSEILTPLNPTGLMIIKKHPLMSNSDEKVKDIDFVCPITHEPLKILGNTYYSKECMLAYPIINDVACLISEYAVVATKMMSCFEK